MDFHSNQNIDALTALQFHQEIDDFPQSAFVFQLKTEMSWPTHQHNKGQLIYIEGGKGYIHLADHTLVIPARHYVWIPKGVPHVVEMHRSIVLRSICFYAHDDDSNSFYTKEGIYPVNPLLLQMLVYTERWNGNVYPSDKDFHFLAAIKNILPEISKNAFSIFLPTTENTRMQTVLQYMNERLSEPLTLTSISKAIGLSERSLSRLFQSTLRISFLQYFKLLRMVKAVELMQQNDMSLSEIAYQLGYNSVSAFSAIFFQLTKVRPSEFAKHINPD